MQKKLEKLVSILSQNSLNVKSKDTVALVREGAELGKRKVRITWFPVYDEKQHSTLPESVKETLRKPKVEVFDIVDELIDVTRLLNNSTEVKSAEWI
jgi:hypothetical protein